MTSAQSPHLSDADAVLQFWFGKLDETGRADAPHSRRFWAKDPAFDAEIRARFLDLHEAALRGACDAWLERAPRRLAYIVLLDQFSRNMFRDTPAAFAADPPALRAALSGIDLGMDRELRGDQRSFFYMPLMHSEELAVQERCVELYRAFAAELPDRQRAAMLQTIGFAERHRDIVRRFGRFPHRNAILGRTSTPDESDFLAGPGSSF